jgi:hypothetical protein
MFKRHLALIILAVFALAFVACDDAPQEGRATVTVRNVNDGAPIESDVLFDDGTSAYITEDLVVFEFISRPYNDYIVGPRGDAILERYTVDWVRTDGGSGTLESREEATSLYLSADNEAITQIRVVSWADKAGPLLSPLVGSGGQVQMRADITFYFREVGTEHEITTKASVSVHFADVVNSS